MTAILFLTKYWRVLLISVVVSGFAVAWKIDSTRQYMRGVADTKAEIEAAIYQSKEMIRNEKDTAISAAAAAARRVCERSGDAAACSDL